MRQSVSDMRASQAMFVIRVSLANRAFYCAIRINNHQVIALPDSGADVSLISTKTADAIELEWVSERGKLYPINSEPFDIIGRAEVNVAIGDKVFACAFYIVNNYDESVLIGCNVLAINSIDISYSKKALVVGDKVLTPLFQRSENMSDASALDHHGRCFRVSDHKRGITTDGDFRVQFKSAEDTIMEPNKARGVKVFSDYLGAGLDVSIESYHNDPAYEPILCEKQMTKSDATMIIIGNFSSQSLTLKKGQLVAIGVPITQIQALFETPGVSSSD